MKDLFEDLIDCIKEYGIIKGMYYSDIFFPIYKLIKLPKIIYNYIDKFIYYGKAGAKTYDFDASSLDILIYAHVKRVRKFMDSDKTHLMWNSERKKGLIRKLYELEELCKRKVENEFNDGYYITLYYEKYGPSNLLERLNQCLKDKKAFKKAYTKDLKIAQSRKKRYDKLMSEYLDRFWD